MFRKRDSNPMESESGKAADVKADVEPELEPMPELSPPEPSKPEPSPPELSPIELTKPEPSPSKSLPFEPSPSPEPADIVLDGALKDSDLPESQPLSAAPKSAAASVSPAASSDTANKRLIVGQGIRLSGEINSCDRLVVEGEVEVTLNDTLALEIASSGRFTGGCEVEEADISGIYEGDLTVRNTLFVRGTGRITGTIRYGQLELERGGQIAGNISVLGEGGQSAAGETTKTRATKTPLFGSSTG